MRTFIAVAISDEVREEVKRIQDELKKANPDVKWVEAENLHITLKFLGEVPEDKVTFVIERTKLAVSGFPGFKAHLSGVGAFPNLRSPRVVWIGVREGSDELARLSTRIDENLSCLGFSPEKRGFSAHLTLGRLRSPRAKDKLVEKIRELEKKEVGKFPVNQVLVMESKLSSLGPRYKIVEQIALL